MDPLLWFGFPLLLLPVGWFLWPLLVHASVDRKFAPSLHDRVEQVLAPHEGRAASPAALAELRRKVEVVVHDTLVDLHYDADDISILVENDDVLGPTCHVRTKDGKKLSLAEFEAQIRG